LRKVNFQAAISKSTHHPPTHPRNLDGKRPRYLLLISNRLDNKAKQNSLLLLLPPTPTPLKPNFVRLGYIHAIRYERV